MYVDLATVTPLTCHHSSEVALGTFQHFPLWPTHTHFRHCPGVVQPFVLDPRSLEHWVYQTHWVVAPLSLG
jgi:hypothetical protein